MVYGLEVTHYTESAQSNRSKASKIYIYIYIIYIYIYISTDTCCIYKYTLAK